MTPKIKDIRSKRTTKVGDSGRAHPGWTLVVAGVLIAVIGIVWMLAPSIPWLGRMPGDIVIERENFRFYFPVATCVLLSLLLTGIMWFVRHCSR